MKCPHCGAEMSFDNQFTYDDMNYIGEGTVCFYSCMRCETTVEVCVPDTDETGGKTNG